MNPSQRLAAPKMLFREGLFPARALARRSRAGRALHMLLLAMSFVAGAASAQTYPDKSRPIWIIVPAGAATASDLLARTFAKALAAVGGLNVLVDNRPGAESVIGIQAFLASKPDGYTMLMTSSSSQTLNRVLIPNLPYDPLKDFVPLRATSKASLVMNLGTSTPFKSGREFIAAAKANPGKYTCASATTTTRLSCEFLGVMAGIKLLNVPYKTTAAAITAVASGEADTIFVDVGSARAQWQTGRVRGVATTGAARMAMLPNLPTLREEGAGAYEVTAWYATYFPPRTPPEIAATMRDLLEKATRTKAFTDALGTFGMEPLDLAGEQLIEHNRREIETWTRVVREANIKLSN